MSDPPTPGPEPGEDPEKLADELERDVQPLQERSEELEGEISGARQAWEAKRRDPSEAGAPPPPEGDADTGPAPDET